MATSIYADSYQQLVRQRAFDSGIELFSAIIEQIPNDAEGYVFRAKLYARASKYDEALADIASALKIDIKNGYAYYVQGDIRRRMEDWRGAVLSYTKAISFGYSEAFNNRGVILMRLRKFRAAFQDFTQAIRKAEDSPRAYHNRGLLRLHVKDYEGASRELTTAISKDANYIRSYIALGYAYASSDKLELARNAFCYYIKRGGTVQKEVVNFLNQMGGCRDTSNLSLMDTQTSPVPRLRKRPIVLPDTKPLDPNIPEPIVRK